MGRRCDIIDQFIISIVLPIERYMQESEGYAVIIKNSDEFDKFAVLLVKFMLSISKTIKNDYFVFFERNLL